MPALGAGLLLIVAFLTTGGDLSLAPVPTSWVDAVLIVAGGCAAGAMIVTRRDGSGTVSFVLFVAVAVLTAVSIAWSVAPDQTWEESGRTVAYVAAFGIALVAARLSGSRSRGAVLAISVAALGLCVWALAVKVLNLNLYGQRANGPALAPFGYPNTTGLTGAIALPGLIWLASERANRPLTRGLLTAGVTVAASVVGLSISRSADAAAVIATVALLCALRPRRRALVMLALGLLAAVPILIYGLTDHNIYGDTTGSLYGANTGNVHRGGAGLVLGLIVLGMAAIAAGVGAALSAYADATAQSARRVAWFDRAMAGLVLAVPAAVVLWLLVNHRGPFGEISHLWTQLTSAKAVPVGGTANRLYQVGSSRPAYWREALSVGEHNLLGGTGAGTFFPAHLPFATAYLTDTQDPHHAHSYLLDTFASFGLVGVALNLALLGAWCRDAARAVSARLSAAVSPTERNARWVLITVVITFGVSSALDWTWYFPGAAVPALIAAGWVAGVSGPRRTATAQLAPAGPDRPAGAPQRPLASRPGAIIGLTGLAVLTLAIAWASLQPMRSVQSAHASLVAQANGDIPAALSDARAAGREDPLSASAQIQLANVYGAYGDSRAERAELITATHTQPDNPQPFAALGGYLLCGEGNRPRYAAALKPLERALMLDLTNTYQQNALIAAARTRTRPSAQVCENIA